MSNTIEWCGAADAVVMIDNARNLCSDEGETDRPVIAIDNGCSHVYVLEGTPEELAAFAERLTNLVAVLRSLSTN